MKKARALFALVALGVSLSAGAQTATAEEQDAGYLFALAQLYRFQGLYEEAYEAFAAASEAAPEDPYVHLEFGEFLFQMGRLEESGEQAKLARMRAPTSREALRLLGRVRLRQAERSPEALAEARASFEQLRAMDPLDVEVRVTLGRLYMSEADFSAAADVLREALDLQRQDRLIASLLVDALSGVTETDPEAVREIERIVEEDPDFLQARLAVAQAMNRSGDFEGAVELLEAAPEAARGNVEYLRLLSFAYYRTGRLEGALESTERWLRKRPDDEQGRYLRAVVLSAQGRESEAESLLSGLVAQEPERLEWSLALADLLDRQGRRDEATDVLRALMARLEDRGEQEERLRTAGLLAQMLARSGDWDGVLKVIQKVQSGESLPAGDPLTLLKADALEKVGRIDEALRVLDEAGGDDRLIDYALGKKAEILFRAGRTEEAEETIAALTDTDDLDRLMVAARSLQSVDLFARSIPILAQAVEMEPGRLESLFLLGAALERSGEVEKAEATFRRLLDLDENFSPALNYLGYMWVDRGVHLDEALALVQRAVALEPSNGAYLDSLGWAYFQKGRFEEAIAPLERAARLVGEDPVVFDHLGDLYRAIGRHDDAAEAYRRAIAIGGAENEAEIRRKLEELTRR